MGDYSLSNILLWKRSISRPGDCPWLERVMLGCRMSHIGYHCFDGCWLTTVTCHSTAPPMMADITSFQRYGEFSHATLRVPASSLTAYRTTDYWNLFPLIIALSDMNADDTTGIDDVIALIDMLLDNGTTLPAPIADLNDDGQVNIEDLTSLISIVLQQ